MNYFDKPAEIPGRLAPLGTDRIAAYLDREDYKYGIDDDGDVYGVWDNNIFYFLIRGERKEILHIQGKWDGRLPVERMSEVQRALNDWNRDHIWPKVYARPEEDGGAELLGVYAETPTDLEFGATDAQLDQLLACGLETGVQAFRHLDTTFPDAARPDRTS